MTEVNFLEYAPGYRNYCRSKYASNTAEKRIYGVNEFVEYFGKDIIETDNFYDAVDEIKDFFRQADSVHNTKVSGIRDFIDYISGQVDSMTSDQLQDIKEKIKMTKLKKDSQIDASGNQSGDVGSFDKNKIKKKLMSDEEIEKAIEAGKTRKVKVLIDLMWRTGIRPGEAAALQPQDIIEEANALDLNDTYVQGKGLQGYCKHRSDRKISVNPEVIDKLLGVVDAEGLEDDDLIFNSYNYVYRSLKDAFTQGEVRVEDGKTQVTPHWLRHNACTRLINEDGNSKEEVQEYMGHSSITVTEGYQHFDRSKMVQVETL